MMRITLLTILLLMCSFGAFAGGKIDLSEPPPGFKKGNSKSHTSSPPQSTGSGYSNTRENKSTRKFGQSGSANKRKFGGSSADYYCCDVRTNFSYLGKKTVSSKSACYQTGEASKIVSNSACGN